MTYGELSWPDTQEPGRTPEREGRATMANDEHPFFNMKDGREICDEPEALSKLLAVDGLLFCAAEFGPFWELREPNDECPVSIHVNCNDLWMWGCADSEPLPMNEVGAFYKAQFMSDKKYATDLWACKRRNMQPQKPIRDRIKKAGEWDDEWEALPKNPDDKD